VKVEPEANEVEAPESLMFVIAEVDLHIPRNAPFPEKLLPPPLPALTMQVLFVVVFE
jgi:hypothetical protein